MARHTSISITRYWISLAHAIVLVVFFVSAGGASLAQQTQTPTAATTEKPAAATSATPAPIPLTELAAQAEATSANLRQIEEALAANSIVAKVAAELPIITREIDARLRENARIVVQRPSLDLLRNLEQSGYTLRATLASWTQELDEEAAILEKDVARLLHDSQVWRETLKIARTPEAPTELARRVEALLAAIAATRTNVEKRRAEIMRLQSRVATQDFKVTEAIELIWNARERTVNQLLVKDSQPIWLVGHAERGEQIAADSQESWTAQMNTLVNYIQRRAGVFALHGAILAALIAAMYWMRQRTAAWAIEDPKLARAASALAVPVATALVLAFMLSRWMYPQAPRVLWAVIGLAALVPTVIVLKRFVTPVLLPVLYALIAFFLVDQARAIAASVPLVPRLMFLGEMLAGAGFSLWFLRRVRSAYAAPAFERARRMYTAAGAAVGVLFAGAAVTNAIGYVALGNLLGTAILRSGYFAIILYAFVEILDALMAFLLRVRPLSLLAMVQRHRDLLRRRTRFVLNGLAILWWVLSVLDRLILRERVVGGLQRALTTELEVGSISISAGDVIVFGLVVWASFLVSRFVRFILDEEIFPLARLQRGLPYAISNTLHYAILVTGFLVAVAAMGFDMTKFTILAGAFTVGVGFGLQNIFNNFVSGLILLFERPVQIGDMIQLDDNTSGIVERIGIRASFVRSLSGSQVIVPNSKLISERVINWTLAGQQRVVEVPISVAHGSNPKRVIEVVEGVAKSHPLVRKDPPPEALLTKPGPDAMGFELHAYTDRVEEWMKIRSELAVAITDALAAEKITIK
jgi:potassium-dependent mechanosensitive channel